MLEKNKKFRIAAFGFRSLPMCAGTAGADKFAMELYPRLVKLGHEVVGYNRLYPGQKAIANEYQGVKLKYFKTVGKMGFDTLLHSFKCTVDIILHDTGDVVHIQNGGNSIWSLFLRLAGKRVFISQDGTDWSRNKWPWYGKIYLKISSYITAYLPNQVIFDNIYARDYFESHFNRKFHFIPFGSDIPKFIERDEIFQKLGITKNEYFLFIGRFIPDKGIHYLIKAFEKVETTKKLVLVGGCPNPSEYEKKFLVTTDKRILTVGFIYGDDSLCLMKNAYCYIQPSDIEGLSPVILNVMRIGTPLICSDIKENIYAVSDTAFLFEKSNVNSLEKAIRESLISYDILKQKSKKAEIRATSLFSWDKVTLDHENLFKV
jgi:glycosyltransferase involved in cell wall biosynthesis